MEEYDRDRSQERGMGGRSMRIGARRGRWGNAS